MKTIEEMSTEELMQLSEEDQAKAFLQGIDIPDGENKDGESPDLDSKNSEELENPEESNDSEEKVILAKDGKNTIPFSELEAAREREKAADL